MERQKKVELAQVFEKCDNVLLSVVPVVPLVLYLTRVRFSFAFLVNRLLASQCRMREKKAYPNEVRNSCVRSSLVFESVIIDSSMFQLKWMSKK